MNVKQQPLLFTISDQLRFLSRRQKQNKTLNLTINPASTVGTSVNLLPSEMPRSWSLPELSRLQSETEWDNLTELTVSAFFRRTRTRISQGGGGSGGEQADFKTSLGKKSRGWKASWKRSIDWAVIFSISSRVELDKCSQWMFGTTATCLSGGKYYFLLAVQTRSQKCIKQSKKSIYGTFTWLVFLLYSWTVTSYISCLSFYTIKSCLAFLVPCVRCRITGTAASAPAHCECSHLRVDLFLPLRTFRTSLAPQAWPRSHPSCSWTKAISPDSGSNSMRRTGWGRLKWGIQVLGDDVIYRAITMSGRGGKTMLTVCMYEKSPFLFLICFFF